MAATSFSLSPSVGVTETDLTTGVPQVPTSVGAIAGVFRWGPIDQRVLVDREDILVQRFGKPTNLNGETWLTAASFLSYSNQLLVSRAGNTTANTVTQSVVVEAANAVVTGNTTGMAVGMNVVSSNIAGIIATGATVNSIVNSTAFTLASGSQALANGTVTIQLVPSALVLTAIANTSQVNNLGGQIIKNEDHFLSKVGTFDSGVIFAARYPGYMGNSLRIAVCDSPNAYSSNITLASLGGNSALNATISLSVGSNSATVVVGYTHATTNTSAEAAVNTAAVTLSQSFNLTDILSFGNTEIGTQGLKVTAVGNVDVLSQNTTFATGTFTISLEDELRLISNVSSNTSIQRFWEFYNLVDTAPGQSDYVLTHGNAAAQDELHVVVVDEDGLFSGVPGTVLETYNALSRASDARGLDGGTSYYVTVLNDQSDYVWSTNPRSTGYTNTALNIASVTNASPVSLNFTFGQNGANEESVSLGVLAKAWDYFQLAEDVDVNFLIAGKARGGINGAQLANYLIDNIAESRKDCVVFVSPEKTDVVSGNGNEVQNLVDFRNDLRVTSYGFLDGNYKYMYDRYNDVYRWVPLCGDMAGLAARTDVTNAPWWSFAGYNRGTVKNVARLAWNPRKAFRDELYKNNINPVITEGGAGTILLGDKTLLTKESAFSRIGIRRLFIYLEKGIATTAKYFLFEFNDEFTRSFFRNTIIPKLEAVQGGRGITDFLVVCDATNNPPDVIDSFTMNCDIYIKPARSINWINLGFVAVRTGVSFTEVVGKAF